MIMIGDMPQQADNGGFLRHITKFGCRTCLCSSEEKHDLAYDIVNKGRYHRKTVQDRAYIMDLRGKQQD